MHYMLLVELPPEAGATESAKDVLDRVMSEWHSDCGGGWSEDENERAYDEGRELPLRCGHRGHKTDWWELGGRYVDFFQPIPDPSEQPLRGLSAYERSGMTDIRDGVAALPDPRDGYDLIRKRDVDWEAMAARQSRLFNQYWAEYEAKADEPFSRYEYGAAEGDTRETYLARHMRDRTYAILTADGRWIERETYIRGKGDGHFEATPDWHRVWDETVAAMPAEAMLAIVDIHD